MTAAPHDPVPTLVGVAHGSRNAAAGLHIGAVLADVAARRPGLPVRAAYVELTAPTLPELLADLDGPAVVVPLLLARGYHVRVDVPQAAAGRTPGRGTTLVTRPFGPDPLLADVLAERLVQAGAARDDAVVLAAAGSRDPDAAADAESVAGLLRAQWDGPVAVGYASAARPSVPEAVRGLRHAGAGRVAIASYLLAPGYFATTLTAAGADLVTAPLSPHPLLADVVLRRYDEGCAG